MTTYKQCGKCNKVVEFAPIKPIRGTRSVLHYPSCFGGNRLDLCGENKQGAFEVEIVGPLTVKEWFEHEADAAKGRQLSTDADVLQQPGGAL